MKYNITSKETIYNGIKFRSILEARWACFFDLCNWKYKYEPFEINGKLPDFILYCNNNSTYKMKQVIVEIKPSIFINKEYLDDIITSYRNTNLHILVLNENPFYISHNDIVSIGLLAQSEMKYTDFYHAEMKDNYDFGSNDYIFDGVMGYSKNRKHFIDKNDNEHYQLKRMWNIATNITKFKNY